MSTVYLRPYISPLLEFPWLSAIPGGCPGPSRSATSRHGRDRRAEAAARAERVRRRGHRLHRVLYYAWIQAKCRAKRKTA